MVSNDVLVASIRMVPNVVFSLKHSYGLKCCFSLNYLYAHTCCFHIKHSNGLNWGSISNAIVSWATEPSLQGVIVSCTIEPSPKWVLMYWAIEPSLQGVLV
jgi:hypothetical protein